MGLENPLHILILLLVVLLVFGAKRLPEIGRSLGSGLRGFKDTLQGDTHPSTLDHTAPAPAPAAYDAALTASDRRPVS
jgi:sec-independent protein translocase protein TatA